ncbi:MAG: hypothetical protein ACPG7F_02320 [Aggregatilineales bacterium]
MAAFNTIYKSGKYIDNFAPGHYARVLLADTVHSEQAVAFKILRLEHLLPDGDISTEYRAFGKEAQLLYDLKDSPHIGHLLDCGYVSAPEEAPVTGEIVPLGRDVSAFQRAMPEYANKGWRPYLALEYLPRTDNLFYLMKPNKPSARRRLPSEEGLTLALQFANLLRLAHSRQIVYLDHKLEHVYWDGVTLRVIDFNSSKQLLNQAADSAEYAKDIHNLCVGILYPAFTGLSPRKTTLRPQPGAQDVVDSRYQDVDELDFAVEPGLSAGLQAFLQKGAAMQIHTIDEFIAGLQAVAASHGRDFPGHYTGAGNREARDRTRKGLQQLREGEKAIREARDLFREAMILDDLTIDTEDELRRLVKAVNAMLNQRVIP